MVPSKLVVLAPAVSFHPTGLYDPKAFITHAALLRQAFAHCAKFPTQLPNRTRVHPQTAAYATFYHLPRGTWSYPVLAHLSASYPSLEGRLPTRYSPARR